MDTNGIALIKLIEAISYQRKNKRYTMIDVVKADCTLYIYTQHKNQQARKFLDKFKACTFIVKHNGGSPWYSTKTKKLVLDSKTKINNNTNHAVVREKAAEDYLAAITFLGLNLWYTTRQ